MSPEERLCLDNVRAKMRFLSLWHHVHGVYRVDTDRVYLSAQKTMLSALAMSPQMETARASASHKKLLEVFELGAIPLKSYRELSQPSLQVTYAAAPGLRRVYCDVDIDLGNPLRDLIGFFIHVAEILWPSKTDPRRVREQIDDEKIGGLFEEDT